VRISEVKRHLDGRIERFPCWLLLRRPHLVVLRFDHEEERQAGDFVFLKGSRSFGFFWRRRSYLLYRMVGPNGHLIAHRFDVVEDVRLDEGEVSYTDLLLDLWVDPRGSLRVEDEDEVAEYARRGLLSAAQRARIERTRGLLLRRHAVIAREAARLLPEAEDL
jgi:protein associated with RNAse G/E